MNVSFGNTTVISYDAPKLEDFGSNVLRSCRKLIASERSHAPAYRHAQSTRISPQDASSAARVRAAALDQFTNLIALPGTPWIVDSGTGIHLTGTVTGETLPCDAIALQ